MDFSGGAVEDDEVGRLYLIVRRLEAERNNLRALLERPCPKCQHQRPFLYPAENPIATDGPLERRKPCFNPPDESSHGMENIGGESNEAAADGAMELDDESSQTAANKGMDLEEAPFNALGAQLRQTDEFQQYVIASPTSTLTPLPSEFEDDSERLPKEFPELIGQDDANPTPALVVDVTAVEPTGSLPSNQPTESDRKGWEANLTPHTTPSRADPEDGSKLAKGTALPSHSDEIQATEVEPENKSGQEPSVLSCEQPRSPDEQPQDFGPGCTPLPATSSTRSDIALVSEDAVGFENERVTPTTPCPQTASMTSPTSPITSTPASSPRKTAVLDDPSSPTPSFLLQSSPPFAPDQLDQLAEESLPETLGGPLAQVRMTAKIMTSPAKTPSDKVQGTESPLSMADEERSPLARVQGLRLPAGGQISTPTLISAPEPKGAGTPTTILDEDQSPLTQMRSSSLPAEHTQFSPSALPPTRNSTIVVDEDERPCTSMLSNEKSTPSSTHTKEPVQSPTPPMLPKDKKKDTTSSTMPLDQLVDRIRQSYIEHGLSAADFQFSFTKCTDDFKVIALTNRTKSNAELTKPKVDQLCQLCDDTILSYLPTSEKEGSRDISFLQKLSKHSLASRRPRTMREAILDLEQRKIEYTGFSNFLINSLLRVLQVVQGKEYQETKNQLTNHDNRVFIVHQAIHRVIAGLSPCWKGLHLLVLQFLLRAGTGNLKSFFKTSTLPAAIQVLTERLNDEKLVAARCSSMRTLLSSAIPEDAKADFDQITPLKMVEGLVDGLLEGRSAVARALGYNDDYHQKATLPCEENVDPFVRGVNLNMFTNARVSWMPLDNRKREKPSSRDDWDVQAPNKRPKTHRSVGNHDEGSAFSSSTEAEDGVVHLPEGVRTELSGLSALKPTSGSQGESAGLPTPLITKGKPSWGFMETPESLQKTKRKRTSGNEYIPRKRARSEKQTDYAAFESRQREAVDPEFRVREFSALVTSFADNLQKENLDLFANANGRAAVDGICDADSVRRLAPEEWFNDSLINTVPIVDCIDTQTFLMPTYLGSLLRPERYESLETWVKLPSAENASRWVFGYWHLQHWLGVKIDWVGRTIQVYDPWDIKRPAVLSEVEAWVQHLSRKNCRRKGSSRKNSCRKDLTQKDSESCEWSKSDVQGPRQADTDGSNCGAYVTWVLGVWLKGRELGTESFVDPLEHRMEIFQQLCCLPTTSGLVKCGEGKLASESSPSSPLDELTEEEYQANVAKSRSKNDDSLPQPNHPPSFPAGGDGSCAGLSHDTPLSVLSKDDGGQAEKDVVLSPLPVTGSGDDRLYAHCVEIPVLSKAEAANEARLPPPAHGDGEAPANVISPIDVGYLSAPGEDGGTAPGSGISPIDFGPVPSHVPANGHPHSLAPPLGADGQDPGPELDAGTTTSFFDLEGLGCFGGGYVYTDMEEALGPADWIFWDVNEMNKAWEGAEEL